MSKKRVRTPTIIQMESIECGAAALGIILGYFGRYVPLEQLRIACGVSRDGSLATNILQAARSYGLDAHQSAHPVEKLRVLKTPFMISWKYNHYVIVEGIVHNTIYVNDPSTGPRKIAWEELKANFTGNVLIFSPTDAFRKEGKPKPLFKLILKRFKGCQNPLSYLLIAGFLLLIPGIALPTFTQYFVDEILVKHLTATASAFIFALICAMLLAAALTALQGYVLARLNSKLSIRLSSQFLWHILRLPVEFYVQRYGGEIAYRVTINDKVVATLTAEIARSFINLLLVFAYGTLMFFYDPTIALIGVCAALVNLGVLMFINRVRTDANIRLQQDMGKRAGISIAGLQNIETIKSAAAETDFFARWAGYYTKTLNAVQQIGKLDIFLSIIPPFMHFLAVSAVLTIGGIRVIDGRMTLGMLLGLQTLMLTFLFPTAQFVYLGQRIQNVKGGLYRLDDVLSNPTDPQLDLYPAQIADSTKLQGELHLKNILFGYNMQAPPLIENFNLHIKAGQNVALIGPSGSGKSTIARLITGLYQPWSGEILFDKKPFNQIDRHILNRSMASIDQQIFLFEGTIRDNLSLWDDTLPEEDFIQAAIDAQIHTDIIQRENGYDGAIKEAGLNFSGGQRQRLEIARALALNPSLLILDEATNALDADTEESILKKIRQRGCSCLVIAHRLNTIKDCDEIIILSKGKVMHRGTHDSLKIDSAYYQELIKSEGLPI